MTGKSSFASAADCRTTKLTDRHTLNYERETPRQIPTCKWRFGAALGSATTFSPDTRRASEESTRRHGMPDQDQAKWHEGQADAIDHFLLDLEWCIKQLPTSV